MGLNYFLRCPGGLATNLVGMQVNCLLCRSCILLWLRGYCSSRQLQFSSMYVLYHTHPYESAHSHKGRLEFSQLLNYLVLNMQNLWRVKTKRKQVHSGIFGVCLHFFLSENVGFTANNKKIKILLLYFIYNWTICLCLSNFFCWLANLTCNRLKKNQFYVLQLLHNTHNTICL